MAYKRHRKPSTNNDEFGGMGFEVARLLGLRTTRAMIDYECNGSSGKYGVVEEDFRCDADCADKLETIVRMYEKRNSRC